jgi:transposase
MQDTIGIDISKDTLDCFELSCSKHYQYSNDDLGQKDLIKWIKSQDAALVVLEATGAYHRYLEAALAKHKQPFAKVNPRRARRFAEATGRLAKTDRVDAAMLAKMGEVLDLPAQEPKSENINILRELLTARRALTKDNAAAKTRSHTTLHAVLKMQIRARQKQITLQIKQIDKIIAKMIDGNEDLSRKFEILISIPGIGQATAFSMLIEMPELGTMTGKQAASLAGLAPISRQSGKWQGKERIQGGRAFFRRAMYMPALCIIRHNLSSKRIYDQMIARGKPAKVAITAIMRKLVVLANVLLRDDRKWTEKPT